MTKGKRIKLARKLRGLSMDALVAKTGGCVSKMSISKYERGIMMPSPAVLQSISSACRLPLEFFSQPSPILTRGECRFDDDIYEEIPQEDKQLILDKAEEYVEAEKLAGTFIPFAPYKRRTIRTYEDAEQAAASLRIQWELGTQPIVSVYELLEMHGIKVLELHSKAPFSGLSFFVDNTVPFVIINNSKHFDTKRRRFTALHELAHLLYRLAPQTAEEYAASEHPGTHKPPTEELLAHRFANAMLLPAVVVRKRIGNQRESVTLNELISIHDRYGISITAQTYRLYNLNIITRRYHEHIYNKIKKENPMEIGWGNYPIPEVADRLNLLHGRNSEEGSEENIVL